MHLLTRCMAAGTLAGFLCLPVMTAQAAEEVVIVEDQGRSWWSSLKLTFSAFSQWFLPTSPTLVAQRIRRGDEPFWKLLADAGYELDEVQATAAWIPGVMASFRLARELSDADREWVERRLDEQLRADSGFSTELRRSVLLMLLEASATSAYRVERLQLVLSPWPRAQLLLKTLPTPEPPGLPDTLAQTGRRQP